MQNSNNLLGDSVLNSNYFNPDYLFRQGYFYLKQFFLLLLSQEARSLGNTVLFLFAAFFLSCGR